jgi:plastocyanin
MFGKLLVRSLMAKIVVALSLVAGFAAMPGQQTISQSNKSFSTSSITINRGDKVVFRNDDQVAHNAFSTTAGNAFNVKTQAPGASTVVSFNSQGTAEVRCAIHPRMRLIVNVK